VFRIVYSSTLNPAVGRAEIESILREARENNGRDGVTGAWLMKDRDCLSALEGPPEAVRRLGERIWDDHRHDNFQLLDMRAANHRLFEGSALAFMDMDHSSVADLEAQEGLAWLCGFAGGPAAFAAHGLPPRPKNKD